MENQTERGGLRCRGYNLPLGKKTYVMGILNLTPDSFSDGGSYTQTEAALRRAEQMVREGADIIDLGAESTRPGYAGVPAAVEAERLFPLLERLLPEVGVPVSVDTTKAVIARAALAAGVHLINDISGLKGDPAMAATVAAHPVPVVVMHNRAEPVYQNLLGEIIADLRESIAIARAAGVAADQIVIDPGIGIGFGKTAEHNLIVMRRLRELTELGQPLLLGTSRKSFIGKVLALPVSERVEGTAATVALSIAGGADIVRVHDVAAMVRVARMTDAIVRGG